MNKFNRKCNLMSSIVEFYRKKYISKPTNTYRRTLRFEQCEDRRMLTVIPVTVAHDVTDFNDSETTLREAIALANQDQNHDTIVFDQSLNGQTIFLNDNSGRRGLEITESVTIDASMLTSGITVDAKGDAAALCVFALAA